MGETQHMSRGSLRTFLTALFEQGRTTVGKLSGEVSAKDCRAALEILSGAEHVHRLEFPSLAPQWSAATGICAAEMFYRACQLASQSSARSLAMRLQSAFC